MAQDPNKRRFKRHLSTARRETRKAVEQFAGITDPLRGHRVEAVRLAREVRDAADQLVTEIERAP